MDLKFRFQILFVEFYLEFYGTQRQYALEELAGNIVEQAFVSFVSIPESNGQKRHEIC
jgi:hypothetical protein